MSTAAVPATGEKAGFWIRAVAIIIDGILVAIVSNILGAILFRGNLQGGSGLGLILQAIYFSWLWSSAGPWPGQTVGMKVLNLKVIKTDGSVLEVGQAFIRWVGLLISCIVLLIGVIWAAFDPDKQGWHDKIAGTYVVKA